MTIRKFRAIDLLIFSVIAAVTDIAVTLFGLLGIKFYLAISMAIIVLVYIRWQKYGLITNGFIAFVHFVLFGITNADWLVALLHAISILGMVSIYGLLQLKQFSIKRTFDFSHMALLFLVGYTSTFLIEFGLYNLILEPMHIVNHLLNHIITYVVGLGLILIMVKQENIAMNMNDYLMNKDKRTAT